MYLCPHEASWTLFLCGEIYLQPGRDMIIIAWIFLVFQLEWCSSTVAPPTRVTDLAAVEAWTFKTMCTCLRLKDTTPYGVTIMGKEDTRAQRGGYVGEREERKR
jgi:hypothetical protein